MGQSIRWRWAYGVSFAVSWFLPVATAGEYVSGWGLFQELFTVHGLTDTEDFVISISLVGALSANAIPLFVAWTWRWPPTRRAAVTLKSWLAVATVCTVVLCLLARNATVELGFFAWIFGVGGLAVAGLRRRTPVAHPAWRSPTALRRIGRISDAVFVGHHPHVQRLLLDAAELRRAMSRDPLGNEALELAYVWVGEANAMTATMRDGLERFGIDIRRTRTTVEALWKHRHGDALRSARAADEALWRLLAAIARNRPASAYR
ncbi:MAG: hypothetical protein AAF721_38235 [Myxococcota bacterium]